MTALFDPERWRMRNTADDPWLSGKEIRQINFLQTKNGRKFLGGCRDFFALWPHDRNRWEIFWREPVLKRRWEDPGEPFEGRFGGWCPFSTRVPGGSQTAEDVAYRLECKQAGRLDEADLIRRVIAGGGVEVRDFPGGSMWIYRAP